MKLVVLGAGVSGIAAGKLGEKLGYETRIVEDKSCTVLPDADLYVTSPGLFPGRSKLYQQAAGSGKEFIGELAFAARFYRNTMLAVTGTNGKTTTTELTTFLLNSLNIPAVSAGNIGLPLSELCLQEQHPVAVVETSNFQLELAPDFSPHAAVLLNLASDHEDRYPGGFTEYCAVKRKIFNHVKQENRIYGLSFADKPHRATVKDHVLYIGQNRVLDLSSTRLCAPHNAENLAAATELLLRMVPEEKLLDDAFIRAVCAFVPGRHRVEILGEKNHVLFVNDSKATNPAAVLAAAESFDRKLVLLLGGLDKGMDFSALARIEPKLRAAILYGEAGEKIGNCLKQTPKRCCGMDFEKAFAQEDRHL